MTGCAVLVTGSNRSGTTWVGRALTASGELSYIHEPFNPGARPPELGVPLGGHYTYVCRENEAGYLAAVRSVLELRPPIRHQLLSARAPKDVARSARSVGRALRARARHQRPLLKDPVAIFSAPWLAERFDVQVVMMIRHPAAYASSIKRLGWRYDFSYLLSQELLLRDHLNPFRAEIERQVASPGSPFDQAILLWKLFYCFVDRCRRRHPEWIYLRHEDLAADPVAGFRALHERLGLRYDDSVGRRVAELTRPAGAPGDLPVSRRHDVRRDSQLAARSWVGRLDDDDVNRVRAGTAGIAERFYTEEEWQIGA